MKALALITACLIASVATAHAQGARGFGAGSRGSSAVTIQPGVRAAPAPSSPGMTQRFIGPGQNFKGRIGNVPGGAVRAPGQVQHGGIFVPSTTVFRGSPFVLGVVPHHFHKPWFFRHHSSVVIIDVPAFFDSGIVATQEVTGFAPSDRRPQEESPGDARRRAPGQVAPFDPTPHEVVERMLGLARIKKSDVVYDLGAGDGRIVIAAAKTYGVHAVGFEIDPGLAKLARENARRAGVSKLVEIRQQDFLTADLSPASVVTLYLSYDGNLAVRSQLLGQLKPHTRVVSYTFDMGDWQPKIAETFRDSEGNSHQLYLWQIGEPILFSDAGRQLLQPQPLRKRPLIIDVR